MLISKTPFRMSFFGGGTDVKEYYEEYGGAVLSTTFDKYCYVVMRYNPPFFKYKGILSYSKTETFDNPEEIEHPVVREILKKYKINDLQIMYNADLPARSGLGSSSAFSVGVLNALHSMRGEFIDKMSLAKEAVYVERVLCKEAGGVQDQLACSFGGLNKYTFDRDNFDVTPIIMSRERKNLLNDSLLLFFTGFVRYSAEILKDQVSNTKNKTQQLHEMLKLVDEGVNVLTGKGDLNDFGRLLDYTWQLKKTLSSRISNSGLDEIYDKAKKAGALGGKVLGAGGGGFVIFFVSPDKRKNVIQALYPLMNVPFEFEKGGTRVIYYKHEKPFSNK